MTVRSRLDGGLPIDSGSNQDVAIAALTRRVAELEHRLNTMKIVIGLVLAVKVIIVGMFVYVLLASSLVVRNGSQAHLSAWSCDGWEKVSGTRRA